MVEQKVVIAIGISVLFGLVLIIGLAVGLSGGGDGVLKLDKVLRDGNGHIGLLLDSGTSKNEDIEFAFVSAAERWNEILEGTIVEEFTLFGGQEFCNGAVKVSGDFTADFLTIAAFVVEIDGVNGILGQAGPCAQLLEEFGAFPILGIMEFDVDDLEALIADDTLNDVILHEMAHVLGIGTFWRNAVQGELSLNFRDPSLLFDPTFEIDAIGNIVNIQVAVQPTFRGEAAVAEYEALTGQAEVGAPVENGIDGNGFIINGAQNLLDTLGSTDAHFEKEEFGDALMTFAIESGVDHPLTRMSIASLEDLGYTVNVDNGDDFVLPSLAKSAKSSGSGGKMHYLGNDVLNFDIVTVTPNK